MTGYILSFKNIYIRQQLQVTEEQPWNYSLESTANQSPEVQLWFQDRDLLAHIPLLTSVREIQPPDICFTTEPAECALDPTIIQQWTSSKKPPTQQTE